MGLWDHLNVEVVEEDGPNQELVFEKVEEDAVLPSRGHESDAGLDLYCQDAVTIPPGGFARVGTGVKVQLYSEEWGLIVGRSSTLAGLGLLVAPGVVDPSYKGELMIAVQNLTDINAYVTKGQRLAQFILMINVGGRCEPVWGSIEENSERGTGGFGSTGS